MDIDDENIFQQMMEEEANLADVDDENQMVLAVLATHEELDVAPNLEGSRYRRKASNDRYRTTGHMLLFNDYFSQNPTNDDRHFFRRFRKQMSVFMNIVHGVRDYDDYFELKKILHQTF